jgi:hypothetical protein
MRIGRGLQPSLFPGHLGLWFYVIRFGSGKQVSLNLDTPPATFSLSVPVNVSVREGY